MKNPKCEKYPLSDEYMVFDMLKYRYVLTAKCLLDKTGINLTARLTTKGTANPQAAIGGWLDRISVLTYRFIDAHAIDPELRNHIIANAPSARPLMQEAMLAQGLYVLTNGDLSLSPELEKRALWFDETAKNILLTPLCETGYSLLYTGC